MLDVLIAGAGPAGSIAALKLARAGARVVLVDREIFPRDKLCGDTLNPGAVRLLSSLGLAGGPLDRARPLRGMSLTGPRASVCTRYGQAAAGLAIRRRDLDAWLLEQAIRAGARFEGGVIVKRPLIDDRTGVPVVRGLVLSRVASADECRLPAVVTIAADGRRSRLARSVGLAREPGRWRRWAYGAYVSDVTGLSDVGEMHIRPKWYLGLAPLTDTLTNVCVVKTPGPDRGQTPLEVIRRAIAGEPALAPRFTNATFDDRVRVLGPLAASVRAPGTPGLLLAGDAAGFVDPMTGDGLHLAMQSALLSAREALTILDTGDFAAAIFRLAAARRARFGHKLRFNRFVRRLVESPRALHAASVGALAFPGLVERAVRYAGDVA
jgi:flavin-dependent dehydrogenase